MEELTHRQTKKTIREIFEDWELDEVVGLPISVMAPPERKEKVHEDLSGIFGDDSGAGPWPDPISQDVLLHQVHEAKKARIEYLQQILNSENVDEQSYEVLSAELRELLVELSAQPHLMVPWNYRGR